MPKTATTRMPPGPRNLLPVFNLISLRRDPIAFFTRLATEYGDVAHFKLGSMRVYLISRPDAIRDILITNNRQFMKGEGLQRAKRLLGEGLLTSEGDFHLRQRRLAQPAFHRHRIAGYAAMMVEDAVKLRDEWSAGETRDIAHEMMRLTLSIAGRSLFGADVATEAEEIRNALNITMETFNRLSLPFSQFLEKLPLPHTRRFRQAKERLDATIYRMIDDRRAGGADHGDLLSMLIQARDEEGDGKGMSNEQLRDEAMTIFLAGHETTANALTWTLCLLSQNPEVESRLHAEIDASLQGRLPTDADYPALNYVEKVFAESMRLYPPAWIIGRRALADYSIDGYRIPAGSILLMSQFVMHHKAEYFPDPYRFDPDRWTPEAKESRPQFSYFPFGGGPRLCIGEHFAWMEGVLVLATLAQKWRLRLSPEQKIVPQPSVTLRPKYGMKMKIEAREH